jgi:hypothetical protein
MCAIGVRDEWIAHQADVGLPLRIEAVEYEDGEVDPNLRSGETRAVGGAIGGEKVSNQRLQGRSKVLDLASGRVHHRLTPSNNGTNAARANQLFDGHVPSS